MSQKSIIFLFLLVILFIVLGPKAKFKNTFEKIEIPTSLNKLDDYILKKESQFNLEKDTRKEIFWFNGIKKTEYGIVYIHGFASTRNEIYPVPNNIAKILKANLFFTRLKGHGINNKDAFKGVKTNDWLSDIDEAIRIGKLISKKLILIGTSNGGAAVIWGLQNNKNDINSAILISPNIYPKDKRTKLIYYPWGKQIAYIITGGYNEFKQNKEKKIQHNTVKKVYSSIQQVDSIISLMGLSRLINSKGFNKIKTPLIIARTPNDQVVDSKEIYRFIKEYGGIKKDIPIILLEDENSHINVGNHNYRNAQITSYLVKYATDFIKKNSK